MHAISTARGRGNVVRLLKKFYAARAEHPAVYSTALQRLEQQASAAVYQQMKASAVKPLRGKGGAGKGGDPKEKTSKAWEEALKHRASAGERGRLTILTAFTSAFVFAWRDDLCCC